jgi:hypothetical protein
MSIPREPDDVKIIASIFSCRRGMIESAIHELESILGRTDWISPFIPFDRTRYYEKEFGWPLERRFVSFRELRSPESLVEIKLKTNDIEARFSKDGRRSVNIDPGYICLERLVLATGKNYTHRIYLNNGIYADLTLIFKRGTFQALPWTYPDYAEPGTIEYFNELRDIYKRQLRGLI